MPEFAMTDFATSMDKSRAAPRTEAAAANGETSTAGVVEMLLKDQNRLNLLLRDEAQQRELLPRMLAVTLTGLAIYSLIAMAILNALWIKRGLWFDHLPAAYWNDWSGANLVLAYTLGFVAAAGICLPSFYFYGLLAGIKTTMLSVAAHATKGMAATAVALVGLLPVYVSMALSSVVFDFGSVWTGMCMAGVLLLPFLAALSGAANLYHGFVGLADTMDGCFRSSRDCFLRRLIFAWTGCATFVTPVVVYSLWTYLNGLVR